MTQRNNDTLATECFKITFYGILLMVIQRYFEQRTTSESIIVTTSFLAIIAIFKLVFPFKIYDRHAWLRVCCVTACCMFSWYLIYSSESVRAATYRLSVQKAKISRLAAEAPAYVIISDSEGIITSTSNNINILTGYTSKELIGQPTTVLMLDAQSAKNQIAFDKAVAFLRDPYSVDAGWLFQGLVTTSVKHKNGNVVPVKIYSGGVRWSTDIQFKGDIDMFAIYFPVDPKDALVPPTSLTNLEFRKLQGSLPAPTVKPMVTIPYSTPTPVPVGNDEGKIIRPK